MSYNSTTERLISLKKLAGKAQTSNDKGLANEGLPSGLTVSFGTVFGEAITTSPSNTSLYTITGKVEYIRFPVAFIAGSDTSSGRHGFELKLPSDYEANSTNPNAGTYPYKNNQVINITSGSLQLVPPSFATDYEAKPYYGGSSTKDSGTQIPVLDARDWYLDYFNGVFFQQDPPGTGDHSNNPDYVEGYLYIGNYLDKVVENAAGGGGGDPNASYLVLSATGSLTAERVFTAGAGILTTDSGAGSSFSVTIDDSIVATLTGSQFSGNIGITGSLGVTSDLNVAEYIKHIGDDDTFIQFADDAIGITAGGEQLVTISEAGQDIVKIGDGGDVDFQVRTLNDDNTLYIEGSTDRIGVGTNSPSSIFHIKETGPTLTLQRENNSNASTINFVGASANTANSIIHDSSTNDLVFKTFNGSAVEEILRLGDHYGESLRQVVILSGSDMAPPAMQPRNTSDISFFVSGAVGSKGTTTRGSSVFGGDLFSSGTIYGAFGITGSLTRLNDGSSYLVGGNNISVTTSSSGQVTITGTSSTLDNAPFITFEADSNLTNERVLTSSSGISIDTSSAGLISIDTSQRKFMYEVTSSHSESSPLTFSGVDFSKNSFSPDKTDIYVNGSLLASGSSKDYVLSGEKNKLIFNFPLVQDDIIIVKLF